MNRYLIEYKSKIISGCNYDNVEYSKSEKKLKYIQHTFDFPTTEIEKSFKLNQNDLFQPIKFIIFFTRKVKKVEQFFLHSSQFFFYQRSGIILALIDSKKINLVHFLFQLFFFQKVAGKEDSSYPWLLSEKRESWKYSKSFKNLKCFEVQVLVERFILHICRSTYIENNLTEHKNLPIQHFYLSFLNQIVPANFKIIHEPTISVFEKISNNLDLSLIEAKNKIFGYFIKNSYFSQSQTRYNINSLERIRALREINIINQVFILRNSFGSALYDFSIYFLKFHSYKEYNSASANSLFSEIEKCRFLTRF